MSLTRYLNGLTERIGTTCDKVSVLEHQKEVIAAPLTSLFSRKELDLASFRTVVSLQLDRLGEIEQELGDYIGQEARLRDILERYGLRDETTVALMREADSAIKATIALLPRLRKNLERQKDESDAKVIKRLYSEEQALSKEIMRPYWGLIDTGLKATGEIEDKDLFSSWKKVGKKGLSMVFYALSLTIASQNILAVEHANADNKAVEVLTASISVPHLEKGRVGFKEDQHAKDLAAGTATAKKTYKQGVATVYADFFQGRETASGEVFRHDKISCAVPIGSRLFRGHKKKPQKLLIRNLMNGKEIVAPVTDVGNFGWNEKKKKYNKYKIAKGTEGIRVVDLSKKAFMELADGKNFKSTRALQVAIVPIFH